MCLFFDPLLSTAGCLLRPHPTQPTIPPPPMKSSLPPSLDPDQPKAAETPGLRWNAIIYFFKSWPLGCNIWLLSCLFNEAKGNSVSPSGCCCVLCVYVALQWHRITRRRYLGIITVFFFPHSRFQTLFLCVIVLNVPLKSCGADNRHWPDPPGKSVFNN